MKITTQLKLEEAAMFIGTILLFYWSEFEWWIYPAFFLAPDIGMLGYLINNKVGAFTYNILHSKVIAVIIELVGIYYSNNYLILTGIIMFGHSSFDRMLGYGLKYNTGFGFTHLGKIGKEKDNTTTEQV